MIIEERLTHKTGTNILGIRIAWVTAADAGMAGRVASAPGGHVVQLLFLLPGASKAALRRRPRVAAAPVWRPVSTYPTPAQARAALRRLWRFHGL